MLSSPFPASALLVALLVVLAVLLGLSSGHMATSPFLLMGGLGAMVIGLCLMLKFEWTLIGLLILRSSLDPFSDQQIPAAFAIALDLVAIGYFALLVLTKKPIKADGILVFFAAWIALKAVWLVLMPLGGLGPSSLPLSTSLREWVRISSWMLVYFLVSQLKGRVAPQKVVQLLFWSLLAPTTAALMQSFLPPAFVPSFLRTANAAFGIEIGSRINGTLGHPATFSTFLILFIALVLWKVEVASKKGPWFCLLMLLVFLLVSTKALTALLVFACFLGIYILPRLNLANALGGVVLLSILMLLFASTEFGRERLASISDTPLLNSDIDLSRAIMMGHWDGNSFNWRLIQWTYLLRAWREFPILGYGLGSSSYLTSYQNYAHNDYVRALTEGGIIGLVMFFLLLGVIAVRLLKIHADPSYQSDQRKLAYTIFAVLGALMVGMITENIWSHTTLLFYFWMLLAIVQWDWSATKPLFQPDAWATEPKISLGTDGS